MQGKHFSHRHTQGKTVHTGAFQREKGLFFVSFSSLVMHSNTCTMKDNLKKKVCVGLAHHRKPVNGCYPRFSYS